MNFVSNSEIIDTSVRMYEVRDNNAKRHSKLVYAQLEHGYIAR